MVPRCEIASSRLMPMPLSRTVSVPLAGSASIQIASSLSLPSSSGFDSARKRSLSLASEALEISSRRKISLWLYREWIISCSSSRTSAWKPSVSRVVDMDDTASCNGKAAVWGRGGGFKSATAQQLTAGHEPVVHLVPEQQQYFQVMQPC